MEARNTRWTQVVLVTAALAGILALSSGVPGSAMQDSQKPKGWLRGRVTDAMTGLGLAAAIAITGPQSLAISTGPLGGYAVKLPHGVYSITAFKSGYRSQTRKTTISNRWAIEYFALRRAPTPGLSVQPSPTPTPPAPEASPPNPTPTPSPGSDPPSGTADRIQLVGARLSPKQVPDSKTAAEWAARSDWLLLDFGFPQAIIQTFRAANPRIVLMAIDMSVSNQTWNKSEFPDEWYFKDRSSGLKVHWIDKAWQLDISRLDVRQNRVNAARAKVAAYNAEWAFLDITMPHKFTKPPYAAGWMWDESGKPADLGDWPGVDGRFQALQLQWHRELRAALGPNILMMYNGPDPDPSWYNTWKARQTEYLTIGGGPVNGLNYEVFAYNQGPMPESTWKAQLENIKELLDQGIYVMFGPIAVRSADSDWARRFIYASYLLIADGKFALFGARHPQWTAGYDPNLHGRDTGIPLEKYQVISTPNGPIYKRKFARMTVWVNPGGSSRTGDGKTIPAHDAVFEFP